MKLFKVEWDKNEDWIHGMALVVASNACHAKAILESLGGYGEVSDAIEVRVTIKSHGIYHAVAGIVDHSSWHKS